MSDKQAVAELARHGYGPVSARGLLLLAEQSGSYTDGNTTVRYDSVSGYDVEA